MANELDMVGTETKQFIVVELGDEQYGIDIRYIDNIVRLPNITRVPNSQFYFRGIINLRGEIVPVMSIRRKMGFEDDVFTGQTRVIILKIADHGLIGVLVDSVKEIVTLSVDDIEKPSHDMGTKNTFINGIGKHKDDLISIFEINSVISEE